MERAPLLRDGAETMDQKTRNVWTGVAFGAALAAVPIVRHRRRLQTEEAKLEARIRSRLGRAVPYPQAIRIEIDDHSAVLSGPVLARAVDSLMREVARVRGVRSVLNHLEICERPGAHPALREATAPR